MVSTLTILVRPPTDRAGDASNVFGCLLDPLPIHRNYTMFVDFVSFAHSNKTRNGELAICLKTEVCL